MKFGLKLLPFLAALAASTCFSAFGAEVSCKFEVSIKSGLLANPQRGRVFVILSDTNNPEPRLTLGRTGPDAPPTLAADVERLNPGSTVRLHQTAFSYPITNLAELPSGDYFAQAVFDSNTDLRSTKAPGNLYSAPVRIHLPPTNSNSFKLELSQQVPPEKLPADTDQIKFVKLRSKLLSKFHHRPIYLRAGIILPRNYEREPSKRYPVWVRIGGFATRYSTITRLMSERSDFRRTWMAPDTPQFILLQLDGAGPFGDPYYVNSANNGPFGDALTQELIPYVESHFRAVGKGHARVLSGTSTGGWVALALQIFYPDFFNGAWSSCPDPVDFRALQLVNLYEDDNAYTDDHGQERPSERDANGNVTLTMRREVGVENLLGRGNSFTLSGEQWGAWNAVYSPRGADGLPVPIWDPATGKIDHRVAEHWQKYDLRLVMAERWKTMGPKLTGKLHIAAGEMDNYYLNNAVHLLQDYLSEADPTFKIKIVYGPGKRHGWFDLSLRETLDDMAQRTSMTGH
jgi:S-formylglutathione hydrolase FrmB